MISNADLRARRDAAVARGVSNPTGIYAAKAENAFVWDVEGKRYIDFAGGIGVQNVGHRHPKVIEAVRRQLDGFVHTAFQVLPYELYVELAEKLNALAPGDFPKKTALFTTGAEANEHAIKIARFATGRPGVIAFSGAFHGRTLLTLALTGKVAPYKTGFGPLPGEVYHAPFPSAFHGVSERQSLDAIEALFAHDIGPERVSAIIIEPVQGEGGFRVAPFGFLHELRALCDRHGILLISDEVQAGMGRTGRYFSIEHSGVVPDLVVASKSLAAGFPLSAVIGRAELMDGPGQGGLGGTFSGNPVACAAALAVLEVLEEQDLLRRGLALGELVTGRLQAMARRNDLTSIGEIRGLGAMIAVELVADRETRTPAPELARSVTALARRDGLIVLTAGHAGNVLRVLVPLTAPDEVVEDGLAILERALVEAEAGQPGS
ncbi:MAG TPA: 4-aminobutyrate--2-oxoglutarate transaminase [Geminicoccus sp.]|uniref:4-aminobutyrate--2-oxoglutarate transaminase n=1 Tax=Geminicoccus sp. TaxID=2024832 RepID=UPI002CFA4623|nr:4-aminobutyrate--2-oxoglutarate transaminase [Geminicoccus sp.]HWL70289.1 4-aminobutyrate--2-oxoglutarate transaminase [Geminicoccus sp.]